MYDGDGVLLCEGKEQEIVHKSMSIDYTVWVRGVKMDIWIIIGFT